MHVGECIVRMHLTFSVPRTQKLGMNAHTHTRTHKKEFEFSGVRSIQNRTWPAFI